MKLNPMLALSAAVFSGAAAHADSVSLDRQIDAKLDIHSFEYRINPDEGRAWVIVETVDPHDYTDEVGGHSHDKFRVKVPGLAFEDNQIVFNGAGGKVVCAHVVFKRRTILISPTGACKVVADEARTKRFDDGFESGHERVLDLDFVAN